MKRIICRFRNKEDLDKLGLKLGLNLSELTTKINLDTKETENRKTKKKPYKMKNTEWEKEWVDMPEFRVDFKDEVYSKIEFYFNENETSLDELKELFEQNITNKTTSVWYPKLIFGLHRKYRVVGGEQPKYPIYVVSKNRCKNESWHTSFRLTQMGVKHYLVVEPQEYKNYVQAFNNKYCTVLEMDLKYKEEYDCFSDIGNTNSTGPGAVRNFCWEHSIKNGFEYHWVLDDNIDGFNRFWRGHKLLCRTGEVFRSCERFIERYKNIAIGGLNYASFCKQNDRVPPYVLNTRIYSMLLIKNDIPYRWRGRYNEDTDLSLRVLKDGWCTIQFNLFLGEKLTTQRKQGGNTEEFYSKDEQGTIPKSQMLVDMHPDVTKLVWKFNRWHHQVDYSGFKQKLILKEEYKNITDNKINEYGMKIVRIPEELCNTENDNREYIENHISEFERIDNTCIYL